MASCPREAVEALKSLSPRRERFKPNYFLWEHGVDVDSLSTKWDYSIRELNKYLDLNDEEGGPMRFHSHMLRDTFAVELLKAGMSLEDVNRLLTHKSIKVTETYYAHWVPERVTELRRKSVEAMKKTGTIFRE